MTRPVKNKQLRVGLPRVVLAVVASDNGIWTDHALEQSFELDLAWEEVVHVASTARALKRERDPEAVGGYKYAMTGRDTRGRVLYMAGKVVTFEQAKYWKVISIHEAD